MSGDARYVTHVLRHGVTFAGASAIDAGATRLFYDPEKFAAQAAARFAWYCGVGARRLIAADQALVNPTAPASPWSLACIGNAVGCLLNDLPAPAYDDYARRIQDAAARQQLLATWLWLRDHAGGQRPLPQRLQSRPPALRSPSRPIQISADGKSLAMAMYSQHSGDVWQLPIPAWMGAAQAR